MKYELCTCCVHRKQCTYRKGRRRVFQCEEFEGIRPGTARSRREEEHGPAGACKQAVSGADERGSVPAENVRLSEKSM